VGQPWYEDGLRFECTACGKCCSGEPGFVWVNAAEVADMARAMNLSDQDFRDRFIRQIGRRSSLKEYPDGDCILLDPQTRHCLVYQARPIQCRTWPFWSSNLRTPGDWQETCQVCPGAGSGKLYSLEQIEIERRKKERL
jgi:Fe-S-cluster containining protein